jgi:hypothetical protein
MGRPWPTRGYCAMVVVVVGGMGCVILYSIQNVGGHSSVICTVTGRKLNGRDSVSRSGRNFLFVIKYGMSVGPKIPPPQSLAPRALSVGVK